MRISKQSILVSLSLALLLAFSLVTGCVSSQGEKTAEAELSDSTVRVPPAEAEAFWDEFGWTDMTKAEQALWEILGWDEDSWEGEAKKPASEDKYWNQLSDEERGAAEKLGYNKESWDEE